jgi:hypothetical protein
MMDVACEPTRHAIGDSGQREWSSSGLYAPAQDTKAKLREKGGKVEGG